MYNQAGTFAKAARICNCDPRTFQKYYLDHGLLPDAMGPERFWEWIMNRAYRKVSRVPDKCPRNCPGWLADVSCIDEGGRCIFPIQFDKDSDL